MTMSDVSAWPEWAMNLLFGWLFVALFALAFATLFWLTPAVEQYRDVIGPRERTYMARRVLVALVGVPALALLWPVIFPVYLGACMWTLLTDACRKAD